MHWLFFVAVGVSVWALPAALAWKVANQRVEYLRAPALGIDVPEPRFGWTIDATDAEAGEHRGVYQAAYQLIVKHADSHEVVWDTSKVQSEENRHVAFGSVAKPISALKTATAYDWTVRVWLLSSEGASVYTGESEPVRFVTGMLSSADSENDAVWLTGAKREDNICRHQFSVKPGSFNRAILYASGLGYLRATLDGHRVTDAELEPGWTETLRTVPYATYDVTQLLSQTDGADHVLGISLGNGWYASEGGSDPSATVPRKFWAKLVVDGHTVLSTTEGYEGGWKCAESAITYDSVYNGEVYDARREGAIQCWDTVEFDDRDWTAAVVTKAPGGKFVSPKMPPIRKTQELTPVSISSPRHGVYIVDFGQNVAGWVQLTMHPESQGKCGENVTIRHAEILQHANIVKAPKYGELYVENLRSAKATDVYIFGDSRDKGKTVVYEPTFTYHGFRYVELTGVDPRWEDIKAIVIHTDVEQTGRLEFSDPLLNCIQSMIHWGQRTNLMSVPTDCHQRDERKGWLGDAQLSGEEALYNFDMAAMHLKYLRDIVDTQDDDGFIGDTSPLTFGGRPSDPSWGAAFPSLVFYVYRETGDLNIIEEFYDNLSRYTNALVSQALTFGLTNMYQHYGDWCHVKETAQCSSHLTASFSLLETLAQMQAMAAATGRGQDALIYSKYAYSFGRAFHGSFYHAEKSNYDTGVQTCMALSLWADVVPDNLRSKIMKQLLADVMHTQDYHVSTGIIGFKYMPEVLALAGRTDVMVKVLQRKDYPSLGFMVSNDIEPATTGWELWDSHLQGPAMNSRNHVMFVGSAGGFMYKFVAGIRAVATLGKAGYKEVLLAPPINPCIQLESVSSSVHTAQGIVSLKWTAPEPGHVNVTVRVPVGAVGRLRLDGGVLATKLDVRLGGNLKLPEVQRVNLCEGLASKGEQREVLEMLLPSGAWEVGVSYAFDAKDCSAVKHALFDARGEWGVPEALRQVVLEPTNGFIVRK